MIQGTGKQTNALDLTFKLRLILAPNPECQIVKNGSAKFYLTNITPSVPHEYRG